MEAKDILERLKAIRKQKGISQSQIAKNLGIEQSMYSKLENGSQQMSLDRLFEIIKTLNINIADLIVLDYSKNEDILKNVREMRERLNNIENRLM